GRAIGDLEKLTVLDSDARQINVTGPLLLRFIHQLVGALNQGGCEAARDESSICQAAEPQAHDPHVHSNWLDRQPRILFGPIEAFDCLPKAFGYGVRLVVLVQIRNQKAELVSTKTGVQVLSEAIRTFLGDQVIRPNLLTKQVGYAFDDAVPDRMTERVVVP